MEGGGWREGSGGRVGCSEEDTAPRCVRNDRICELCLYTL